MILDSSLGSRRVRTNTDDTRNEQGMREKDASGEGKIVKNVSLGSLFPQVHEAALQGTEAISFLKLENGWC